eukprot:7433421-Pyramimonas_sp.AAC.1
MRKNTSRRHYTPLDVPGAHESSDSCAGRSLSLPGSSEVAPTYHLRWTYQEPTKVAAVAQVAAS